MSAPRAHASVLPPGVAVRPMRTFDIDAGLRLCRASGWNQLARDWEQFLQLEPEGARVVERDGRVIGTVATLRHGSSFGWIGLVLVDPAERGRGIGTFLLDQGLALLEDMPLVRLDATAFGRGLYAKRGFAPEYEVLRMQATAPEGTGQPTTARRMTEDDLDEVIARDARISGVDRTAMLRWLWQGAPEYAWVTLEDGRMAGYTFGRHGNDFEHIGPIGAVDAAAARHLAMACLAGHSRQPFIIDVPDRAIGWTRGLEDLGFRQQRVLTRMCLGSGDIPGAPSKQFAVIGPEFG